MNRKIKEAVTIRERSPVVNEDDGWRLLGST